MTAAATLTTESIGDGRLLTVDCSHGTTSLAFMNGTDPGTPQITEVAAARMVVAHHYAKERCNCTRRLRQRYGV
ncbi:MAG TPA: hypothetical protein VGR16_00955 [Thermomicrobiales bacterium]|nr:hypothetical protein [Thermomicrobiales bacterium]